MIPSKLRAPGVLEPIEKLGCAVQARWRKAGHNCEIFSSLALQALEEAELHQQLGLDEILQWVFESDCLPSQHDLKGKFGQPPITLFRDDRFSISALVWIDADTSIHQHRFSGAFSVLSGSSLHRTFRFEEQAVVTQAMKHGQLVPLELEILKQGDCRRIEGGSNFIHTVFHLARPTVSLVIRTHSEPITGPQWDYSRAGLAVDPFAEVKTISRLRQVAATMARLEHRGLVTRLMGFIERADAWSTLQLLRAIDVDDFGRKVSSDVLRRARAIHGELGEAIVRSVYDQRIADSLLDLRRKCHDEELEYFLALALNVVDRGELLRFLKVGFPDCDPIEKATESLRDLLPVDEKARRTAGPMAIAFAREILKGRSTKELMSEAQSGESAIPAREVARLSLLLPSLSLFRAIFDADAPR